MHLTLGLAGSAAAAAHGRSLSASLPRSRSHPVLARLDGGVRALRSWSASPSRSSDLSGGQSSGVALVEAVLAALGELLSLPRAAAALHAAAGGDGILDVFLVLADAYGTFGQALLALRQSVAGLQAAVRRRGGDGELAATSLRERRRTEKELRRLATTMRHVSRRTTAAALKVADTAATDSEVITAIAEAAAATVDASEAIFLGCASMSPDAPAIVERASSNKWLTRLRVRPAAKKAAAETAAAALERLEQLEECIGELESGSEKVFRRLLQCRVSLLNINNPF